MQQLVVAVVNLLTTCGNNHYHTTPKREVRAQPKKQAAIGCECSNRRREQLLP